jgi:putative spermidine/putrescine transport system permease protein
MLRRRPTAAFLLFPASAVVVAFLCLPLILMFRYSLNRFVPGQFMVDALTFENYAKFISDPYYTSVLAMTVAMAIGVTLVCLVFGFPAAMYVARARPRSKAILLLLIILPLFVGNAVRAAGWMVAFGQKGLINYLLAEIGLVSEPVTMMYTPAAVFVGIVSVNLPFVILTLQSVLEGIEQNVVDAAQSLGATPFETWRLVTLPLAVPGLLAASVLSFILTMNAYATPVLLGGPTFQMAAPVVANEVLQQANWPFGATIAFALMGLTLLLTAGLNIFVARRYMR